MRTRRAGEGVDRNLFMAIDGGGIFVFHAGWLILPIRLYFPFSISRKKGGGIDGGKVSGDSGENDIGFSLHTCFRG